MNGNGKYLLLCIFFGFMSLIVLPFSSGRGGFLWPGLNSPVMRDGTLQRISRRGETEQQEMQAELGTETKSTKCLQTD